MSDTLVAELDAFNLIVVSDLETSEGVKRALTNLEKVTHVEATKDCEVNAVVDQLESADGGGRRTLVQCIGRSRLVADLESELEDSASFTSRHIWSGSVVEGFFDESGVNVSQLQESILEVFVGLAEEGPAFDGSCLNQ